MSRPPPLWARAVARAADALLHALPPATLLGLAEGAGLLYYAFAPARRRVIQANLRIALGEARHPRARRRLARAACRSLARVFAETAIADRLLGTEGQIRRRVRYLGDWEALRGDAAGGRGGLIVTAHLGNWELGALAVRHRGVGVRVVARPLDSAVLEAYALRRRGGAGRVIGKVGGLRAVLGALGQGQWVALLGDQNAGRHGLFVPFFGLAASTFPTAAVLAVRRNLPVYLGACLRRGGRRPGFDVHLQRLMRPPAALPRADRVRRLLEEGNRVLEGWIRRAPEQYNWAHRRWKTRPQGGAPDPRDPFYVRHRAPQPGRALRPVD